MPMRDAIKSLDYQRVLAALQRNEDPNQIFADEINVYLLKGTINGRLGLQMTPLLFAIDRGREDIADLLIKHGAQSDVIGCDESALNHACKKGMFCIAKILLEKGAKTDREDFQHETLLMSVVTGSHLERTNKFQELATESLDSIKDMLHALQQHGVSLDPIGNIYNENCPLYFAACLLKDKGLVGLLLAQGASIHLVNCRGHSFLERLYEAEYWENDHPRVLPVPRRVPVYRSIHLDEDAEKDLWPNNTWGIPAGFKMLSYILNTLSDLGRDDQIEKAKDDLQAFLQCNTYETERRARIAKILEGYLACQKRVQTQIKAVGGGVDKDTALSHAHILDFLTRREQHIFSAASKTKKTETKIEKKRSREEIDAEIAPLARKAKVVRS